MNQQTSFPPLPGDVPPPNAPSEPTGRRIAELMPLFWTAFVAFIGVIVSAILSYIKYASDYACNASYLSACAEVGGDCASVFHSPLSELLGLPITLFGTGFYGVALYVAGSLLLGKKPLGGAERPFLVLMGFFDTLVSVGLALYAKLVMSAVCLYCMSLYLVSFGLFGCALWAGGSEALSRIVRAEGRRVARRAAPILVLVLSLGVLLLVPQAWLYRSAQAAVGFADCRASLRDLPNPAFAHGSASPKWVFAELLDPSCPHCRAQHETLSTLLLDPQVARDLSVRVYLYPRQPQSPCAPRGFDVSAKDATDNDACRAALAITCAEKQKPGNGLLMLDRVLDLQDEKDVWFSRSRIKAQAEALGLATEAFTTCMESDEAAQLVQAEMELGSRYGLRETPRLYAIPVVNGVPDVGQAFRIEGDKPESVYRKILESDLSVKGGQ